MAIEVKQMWADGVYRVEGRWLGGCCKRATHEQKGQE